MSKGRKKSEGLGAGVEPAPSSRSLARPTAPEATAGPERAPVIEAPAAASAPKPDTPSADVLRPRLARLERKFPGRRLDRCEVSGMELDVGGRADPRAHPTVLERRGRTLVVAAVVPLLLTALEQLSAAELEHVAAHLRSERGE